MDVAEHDDDIDDDEEEDDNLPALRDPADLIRSGRASDAAATGGGRHFRFAATGLWAGALIGFVVLLASVKLLAPGPERSMIFWILTFLIGGFAGTAAMHERLQDMREVLAQTRADLERKSAECKRLQGERVRDLRTSVKPAKKPRKGSRK